ncbi:MAG: TonB-dependent receptor, partial [Acidobacteriota bacterium]
DDGSKIDLGVLWSERDQQIAETLTGEFPDFIPTYFIDERARHARASWSRPFGLKAKLRAGLAVSGRGYDVVDVRFNLIKRGLGFEQALQVPLRESVEDRAAWVEGELALGSRADLLLGLRWVDYRYADDEWREPWLAYSLPEGRRVLPRACLTFKPSDAWSFRLATGGGFRQPPPGYEEVCCGRVYRRNRGILMERSRSANFEATYRPGPYWSLYGMSPWNEFDDLITSMVTQSFVQQLTYQNVNVPRARVASLTLTGAVQLSPIVSLQATGSWSDA